MAVEHTNTDTCNQSVLSRLAVITTIKHSNRKKVALEPARIKTTSRGGMGFRNIFKSVKPAPEGSLIRTLISDAVAMCLVRALLVRLGVDMEYKQALAMLCTPL